MVAVRVPREKKKETHRRRASSPGLSYPKVSSTQLSLAPPTVPFTSVATAIAPMAVPTLVPMTTVVEGSGGGVMESSPSISKVMETVQSTRRLLVASQLSEQKQVWGGGREWGGLGVSRGRGLTFAPLRCRRGVCVMKCLCLNGIVFVIQPSTNNGLNTDELREALLMMMKSRDELAETNRWVCMCVCMHACVCKSVCICVCVCIYIDSMCLHIYRQYMFAYVSVYICVIDSGSGPPPPSFLDPCLFKPADNLKESCLQR